MLSAEGNENGEKTTIVQHSFSVHFFNLPLFCTIATWNFHKLPSYTFYGENMSEVFLFTFFHCRPFPPWWPPASRRHKISCCSYNKKCLLFFLSRSSSFSRWASLSCRATQAFSCSLSFSFSIFQICGHDNWSKLNSLNKTDTETFSAFRFRFDS